jgi:hypothetical protein
MKYIALLLLNLIKKSPNFIKLVVSKNFTWKHEKNIAALAFIF